MNGFKGYTAPLFIGYPEVQTTIINPLCEICGQHRSKSHIQCSKIKQARYEQQRQSQRAI
jgi:hypothetical protein